MKPKLLLTLAAIYGTLGGIGQLLIPTQNYYLDASTSVLSINLLRSTSCLLIGLAVVYWLARNAEASKARDAILIGSSVGFGLNAIFVVLAAFSPGVRAGAIWTVVVINLLFAIAFFMVGRANMSTSAS
ncbi:MAG: hypothetical protein ACK2U1_13775 [Anaerolineales bacterium]|jgi:hypothetical protein